MKRLAKRFKSLIKQKEAGNSELIASMIAITAIIAVMLLFVYFYRDIQVRIDLDQICRQYVLRLEATDDVAEADIKASVENIPAVKKALTIDSSRSVRVTINKGTGYGTPVSVEISAPVATTGMDFSKNGGWGVIHHKKISTCNVKKQSTQKY